MTASPVLDWSSAAIAECTPLLLLLTEAGSLGRRIVVRSRTTGVTKVLVMSSPHDPTARSLDRYETASIPPFPGAPSVETCPRRSPPHRHCRVCSAGATCTHRRSESSEYGYVRFLGCACPTVPGNSDANSGAIYSFPTDL